MKLLATSALLGQSLLALKAPAATDASSVSSGDAAPKLQGTCTDQGKLLFTVPYSIANSKVLKLKAGRCDETAADDLVKFSQPNADQAQLELDIKGCGLADNRYENTIANRFLGAGAGYFTGEAVVEFGRYNDLTEESYRFYNASLRTECGVATDYTATFSYGKVHHISHVDDVVPGDYTEIQFKISASLDNFNTDYNSTNGARAGDTMYFGVAPSGGFQFAKYDFAVSSCHVQSGDNKVVLFDHAQNSCDNDFIDFTYQPLQSSAGYGFNMTHRLFVVGNGQFAEQNLTCNIKLCDRNDDGSLCNTVYKNCDLNQCSCNFGVAATGADCDVNHSSKCMSCEFGYYLDTGSCYENQCKCADGNPSVGKECPKNQETHCKSCYNGFHKKEQTDLTVAADHSCHQNRCTCDNGDGARGTDCATDGIEHCIDCNKGYHVEDKKCVLNQCTCANGEAASGENCDKHDTEFCSKCDDYYLVQSTGECKIITCTCADGVGATGADCVGDDYYYVDGSRMDGDEWCASCYSKGDAVKPDGKCGMKQCKCSGGTAASGEHCDVDDTEQCDVCDEGYHKESGIMCVLNQCTCINGVGSSGTACKQHDTIHCAVCDDSPDDPRLTDYFINPNNECQKKQCKCEHGEGASGYACSQHDSVQCTETCDAGYFSDFENGARVCKENKCKCDNGKGYTGSQCVENNFEACASCDDGYNRLTVPPYNPLNPDNSYCQENECTCTGGYGAIGVDCPVHDTELCEYCKPGYHEIRRNINGVDTLVECAANKCTCGGGVAAHSGACDKDQTEQCQECYPDYAMIISDRTCEKKQSAPP